MDYTNLNLRNKTFIDFTTDEKLISEIVGDREFFLSHITDFNRAHTFIDFADYTPDVKLAKAIRKEFETECKLFFNE